MKVYQIVRIFDEVLIETYINKQVAVQQLGLLNMKEGFSYAYISELEVSELDSIEPNYQTVDIHYCFISYYYNTLKWKQQSESTFIGTVPIGFTYEIRQEQSSESTSNKVLAVSKELLNTKKNEIKEAIYQHIEKINAIDNLIKEKIEEVKKLRNESATNKLIINL